MEHCKAAIRTAFRPTRAKRARSVLSKVLIAAVLCGIMTSAACAFSPSFREFLVRVFYSVADTFTAITFQDPQVEDVGSKQGAITYTNHGLRFEWIPEGYAYVDGSETPRTRRVDFENAQSGYIRVQVISHNDVFTYNYDSESGAATQVAVGSFEAPWWRRRGSAPCSGWTSRRTNLSLSPRRTCPKNICSSLPRDLSTEPAPPPEILVAFCRFLRLLYR